MKWKIILATLFPLLFAACTPQDEVCAEPLLPTVTRTGEGQNDGYPYAVFEFANESTVTYRFRGYEPAMPVYLVEQHVEGAWQAGVAGVCGTGLGVRELAPGESCSFQVALEGNAPIRVGVELVDETGILIDTIWSE